MKNREKTPLIACNLCCILERKEDADLLAQKLQRNGLGAGCIAPKYAKASDVKITNIPLTGHWYLDEALEEMFSQLRAQMDLLKEIRRSFQCSYIVDIECHKGDVYPALVLSGKNMEYIRLLESDVSIDLYDDL